MNPILSSKIHPYDGLIVFERNLTRRIFQSPLVLTYLHDGVEKNNFFRFLHNFNFNFFGSRFMHSRPSGRSGERGEW